MDRTLEMAQTTLPPGLPKGSPLGDVDGRSRPPAIIPIATIPQHILASFPAIAAQNQQGMLQTHPLFSPLNPGLFRNEPMQGFRKLTAESLPTRLPSYQNSEEEMDEELLPGEDPRHNRRREMNRIAQQKSRLKKDQKITDLQAENDQLKARIISLDAEVKVWKNMTKKSENEANDLRRKLEEKEEKIQEQIITIRRYQNKQFEELEDSGLPSTIKKVEMEEEDSMDGLRIDEQPEEQRFERPRRVTMEPELVIGSQSTPETKYEMMVKEIQSLTTELQRMYTLTNQQAEATKLLHQALDDQQRRFQLHEKKEEGGSQLELSPVQQVAVAPAKKLCKAQARWLQRNVSRGKVAKTKLLKLKSSR